MSPRFLPSTRASSSLRMLAAVGVSLASFLPLPWLVRHGRWTLDVIGQIIAFSLAVKALFVVLTFAGWLSLWGAIAADTGASLLVIFNVMRLLRTNPAR